MYIVPIPIVYLTAVERVIRLYFTVISCNEDMATGVIIPTVSKSFVGGLKYFTINLHTIITYVYF